MESRDIQVGKTYRFKGYGSRELKSRTVVSYDPDWPMPGGRVISHTGKTRSGYSSQADCMAGNYFAAHVLED
jgi:hypothetical protein